MNRLKLTQLNKLSSLETNLEYKHTFQNALFREIKLFRNRMVMFFSPQFEKTDMLETCWASLKDISLYIHRLIIHLCVTNRSLVVKMTSTDEAVSSKCQMKK